MEGKDKFKKIDIKNRTGNCFDYAMKIININLKDILLDEKKPRKQFITTFIGSMQLRINFNKTAGFIRIFDGIRYLVLFSYLYDKICDRIKFLMKK